MCKNVIIEKLGECYFLKIIFYVLVYHTLEKRVQIISMPALLK